ncbi:uncharacterized protein [Watersipora subatra]|uniref:uncharacterized protein n=1 Tax=Watersipora subatra TaxID=2589382 RepID=UPI00355B48CE
MIPGASSHTDKDIKPASYPLLGLWSARASLKELSPLLETGFGKRGKATAGVPAADCTKAKQPRRRTKATRDSVNAKGWSQPARIRPREFHAQEKPVEKRNYYQSLSEASPDAFQIPDAAYTPLSELQGRYQKRKRVTTKAPRTTPTRRDNRKPLLKAAGLALSSSQERRPQERRPLERRPLERRPQERRPQERRPQERRPQERRPQERRPQERRPQERRPQERRPQERRPQERRPQERRPQERRPQERRPQERRPQEPWVNPGHETTPRTNFAPLQREGTSSPSEDALENTAMARALSLHQLSPSRKSGEAAHPVSTGRVVYHKPAK